MTLILTVGNPNSVHQSSDYQLTDATTGAPVSDSAGSKQLVAQFQGLQLELSFTGVAVVGAGSATKRTVDWLLAALRTLPSDSKLPDICNSLSAQATPAMKPLGERGILTMILTVAELAKRFRIAVISNAAWNESPPRARDRFSISIREIKKPFILVSGFRDSMTRAERHRLKALARNVHRPPKEIADELAAINAIAARNSSGYVSEGCWVTSQYLDGPIHRSSGTNVGLHAGSIPQSLSGFDVSDWVKRNFRAQPGKDLRLVGSSGVMVGPGGGMPIPPPEGEPRRFVISSSPATGLLRSPTGEHCASIEFVQSNCTITARQNEEVTQPFAHVKLCSTQVKCADFPRPLLPWPTLSVRLAVDGTEDSDGWIYNIGHWIERGVHHVVISTSIRAIRLPLLGVNDELLVAAPTPEAAFEWEALQDGPTATLQARVQWRTR